MADVMISYARADQDAARILARRLAADGFDVWFDREIPPGETFDEVIDRALREARKVVVLWSRQSVGSRWVVAEAEEAASMAKLVPARLDDSVIPLEFRRVQAADLIGWRGDADADGYRVLLATLRNGGERGGRKQATPSRAVAPAMRRDRHPGRWMIGLLVLAAAGVVLWGFPEGLEPGPGVSPSATDSTAAREPAPTPVEESTPTSGEAPSAIDEAPPAIDEAPTLLQQLEGVWQLIDWRERVGDVTLYMGVIDGTMVIDGLGNSYWDLELDDGGPPPSITPRVLCVGIVREASSQLEPVKGELEIGGEPMMVTERDWTNNLQSLRADAAVAFCGWTNDPMDRLSVYDETFSAYELELSSVAGDAGSVSLSMRNAAGTFRWVKTPD
jgi:hypothetical protein